MRKASCLLMLLFVKGACAQDSYSLTDRYDCRGSNFVQVTDVGGLPPGVRSILLKEGQVADRGQPYQDTDVVTLPHLPNRRLALGAVSDRLVAAVIERSPLPTQTWLFQRNGDRWNGTPVGADPTDLDEIDAETLSGLLYVVCRGYPQPDPPAVRAVSGIITGKGNIVLTVRSAGSSVAYELIGASTVRSPRDHREVRYLSTDRTLSQSEREGLRIKLGKILQSLKEGDSNRPLVAAYLKALGTYAMR